MKYTFNWFRFFIAALFFLEQSGYFGWNPFPRSDAEMIADGITMLLTALCWTKKDFTIINVHHNANRSEP